MVKNCKSNKKKMTRPLIGKEMKKNNNIQAMV